MNSLNSILIEGNLHSDPIQENDICEFKVRSYRYYKHDNEQKRELTIIPVKVDNERLVSVCMSYLKEKSAVRVVGRLVQKGKSLCVLAEHVDIKKPV